MAVNPVTGMAEVDICGKTYSIRFDWDALAAVNEAHGDAPNLFSAEVVASVAAIGMRKHHPEMTSERITELSPPIVPFATEVQRAIQWAYFGPEGLPEESEAGDEEKKSPKKVGWLHRLKRLFGMA